MSSRLDLRAVLRLGSRLSLYYLLLFGVLALALAYGVSRLVWEGVEDEWSEEMHACHAASTDPADPLAPPAPSLTLERLEESVRRHFLQSLPWLLIPALFVGFAGGLAIVLFSTRGVQQLVRTVQEIRRTGRYEERLTLGRSRGSVRTARALFNEMLDLTEQQMSRFRESLDSIAHDLRSPLARLRGGAEAALQGDADTVTLRAALSDCLEESEQLGLMLDALMSLAEAEAGALRLRRESVAVRDLLGSVVDTYRFVGEDRNIDVVLECDEGLRIDADPGLLRQAIANLVDNAVKFSPEGTTVHVRAHREGEDVCLQVLDEGKGIPEDESERIWERLYRGDGSRGTPGLGLGLSFVRAIVEAHGGTVLVANGAQGGAVFTVRVPDAAPAS